MPEKNETDPVTDDEWLFRRVHETRFRTSKTPFVSPGAFEPRTSGDQADVDGISLFRAACLDKPGDVLVLIVDSKKRDSNGIVKISVGEIRALGLSVVSTPLEEIRGHVSIPELSSGAFADMEQKAQCKLWMNKLADLASPENRIVLDPIPMIPRN